MERSDALLLVRGVHVELGGLGVLNGVDLTASPGEVVGLVGTNGAGKSTLLRVVGGLLRPSAGSVVVDGDDVTGWPAELRARHGVGLLPAGRGTFPSLTVAENLVAGAYTVIFDRPRATVRIDRVLELFPILRDRLDQRARTLSGGEQQMLGLAKTLLLEPRVLLIDELTLGIAPVAVEALLSVVDGQRREGVAVVLVEQSLNVAASICDTVVYLDRGEVRFEGPPDEFAGRDDLVRSVFLAPSAGDRS